jgi:hypothetical protein
MERAAARERRELAARSKEAARWEEQRRAEHEVKVFDNQVEFLLSMHKDCGPMWNWRAVSTRKPPAPPHPTRMHEEQVRAWAAANTPPEPTPRQDFEQRARAEASRYQPTLVEKVLGQDKKRLAEHEAAIAAAQRQDAHAHAYARAQYAQHMERVAWEIAQAQQRDAHAYGEARAEHAREVERFQWELQAAAAILRNDLGAYRTVLQYLSPFAELIESGMEVSVTDLRLDVVVLQCVVEDDSIMPREEKRLTAAGKLTSKAMPANRYWAIYQDYVCGCALRAVREVFALLPVPRVVVNVSAARIDTATGRYSHPTILALSAQRDAVQRLFFETLDPSDSLVNFDHRMKFKKTSGFEPVEPIKADDAFITTGARTR